ncbi:hypothetical protein B296_00001440, partial [Ensete ventricosum]
CQLRLCYDFVATGGVGCNKGVVAIGGRWDSEWFLAGLSLSCSLIPPVACGLSLSCSPAMSWNYLGRWRWLRWLQGQQDRCS